MLVCTQSDLQRKSLIPVELTDCGVESIFWILKKACRQLVTSNHLTMCMRTVVTTRDDISLGYTIPNVKQAVKTRVGKTLLVG